MCEPAYNSTEWTMVITIMNVSFLGNIHTFELCVNYNTWFLFLVFYLLVFIIFNILYHRCGKLNDPIQLRLYSYNQCVEWMSRQNSDKFVWCLNSKWCLWLNDCKYCKYEQSSITLNYKWSHWTSPNLVISTRNVHNVHSNVMFFFWCVYTLWDNWFIFSVVYYLKRNVWRSL